MTHPKQPEEGFAVGRLSAITSDPVLDIATRDGMYIANHPDRPNVDVPLVSVGGRVFVLVPEQQVALGIIREGTRLFGPFRSEPVRRPDDLIGSLYVCHQWQEQPEASPITVVVRVIEVKDNKAVLRVLNRNLAFEVDLNDLTKCAKSSRIHPISRQDALEILFA
jgi:hypothetical protein